MHIKNVLRKIQYFFNKDYIETQKYAEDIEKKQKLGITRLEKSWTLPMEKTNADSNS